MKRFFTSPAFAILIIFTTVNSEASWLIDAERFHVSVHGQISCQDCHGDIFEKNPHPDPEDVNRALNFFFRPEQCTQCHSEIWDEIDAGTHGGQLLTDQPKLKDCLSCHNPHYEQADSDAAIRIDLSQPTNVKCSICHELKTDLPEFSPQDEQCMGCHRFLSPENAQAVEKITVFCFHCHGTPSESHAGRKTARHPLIDVTAYRTTPHANVACTICHPQAAEFRHEQQIVGDCQRCHLPHDAKMTNEVHLGISCGTCHLKGVMPLKETRSAQILWKRNSQPGIISEIHHIARTLDDASCRSCHFSGNTVGAAAMVLPAKSVICMPCHAATFSVGDTVTILSLIVFLLGIIGLGSVWFSGTLPGAKDGRFLNNIFHRFKTVMRAIFSTRIPVIIKILILDGLLQRRLFRASRTRWGLHALVFYSFVFRFTWGLVALVGSLWFPEWSGIWMMLDRNHPLTAFLFDFTGLMAIAGVIGMIIRRKQRESAAPPVGLPKADWPAYTLLGGIIMVGFFLEGMRIAMAGTPGNVPYAFIGNAISRMLTGFELTGLYGYVWYLHAILTGAFVAYVPFSRMLHMIMAPVALALNASFKMPRNNN